MALSRNYPHGLIVAFTVAIIFSLTFLPPKSVGSVQKRQKVLGSRPPVCVNKCLSCRPCMATLVVPPLQNNGFPSSSSHGQDDTYYLLSWKCKCGDQIFQP